MRIGSLLLLSVAFNSVHASPDHAKPAFDNSTELAPTNESALEKRNGPLFFASEAGAGAAVEEAAGAAVEAAEGGPIVATDAGRGSIQNAWDMVYRGPMTPQDVANFNAAFARTRPFLVDPSEAVWEDNWLSDSSSSSSSGSTASWKRDRKTSHIDRIHQLNSTVHNEVVGAFPNVVLHASSIDPDTLELTLNHTYSKNKHHTMFRHFKYTPATGGSRLVVHRLYDPVIPAIASPPLDAVAPVPSDAATGISKRGCGWGQYWSSTWGCACDTGFVAAPSGSQCCSPNSHYVPGSGCVCNPGTWWNQAAATCSGATPTCPWGTWPRSDGNCPCNGGWWAAPNGQCCPPNSNYTPANGCRCNSGLNWDGNGNCVSCKPGTRWDSAVLKCAAVSMILHKTATNSACSGYSSQDLVNAAQGFSSGILKANMQWGCHAIAVNGCRLFNLNIAFDFPFNANNFNADNCPMAQNLYTSTYNAGIVSVGN
ncbi:hypothetical protein HDU98_001674 [Podochytrium sp. JEL0797]|nr:hypothetical protein HDU98_001674 [Podochytrium sp. JEL0797]